MSTTLLDGLEMFLGVGVMFLVSSKLQMAGGWYIYREPFYNAWKYFPMPSNTSQCLPFVLVLIDFN